MTCRLVLALTLIALIAACVLLGSLLRAEAASGVFGIESLHWTAVDVDD